jgi:uncharacterized RDD family membrane protein YckC
MTDIQSDVAPNEFEGDVTPTIAPSEVAGWVTLPAAPWRRYGARFLDILASGGLGFFVFGFAFAIVAPISADKFFSMFEGPGGRFLDLFCTTIMGCLINAILMATVGTTVGKAIFGIRVRKPDRSGLGFAGSFAREFKVWVFGLGFGVPILTLIAMIVGFNKLKSEGQSSWDKGHYLVMYRQAGSFQTIMNFFGVAMIIAGRLALIALSS